jgi:hypothetical protein
MLAPLASIQEVNPCQAPPTPRLRSGSSSSGTSGRAKIVALCIVTTFTALLITLILVLAGGDSPTTGSNESQDQAAQQAPDLRVGPYASAASVPAELQRSTPGGVGR